MNIEQPIYEDPLISSIKVSSAAIRIRPKLQTTTVAKRPLRHLSPRHDNSTNINSSPNAARVIVTKHFDD